MLGYCVLIIQQITLIKPPTALDKTAPISHAGTSIYTPHAVGASVLRSKPITATAGLSAGEFTEVLASSLSILHRYDTEEPRAVPDLPVMGP